MFLEIDRDCVVGEEENKVKHNFVPQKNIKQTCNSLRHRMWCSLNQVVCPFRIPPLLLVRCRSSPA